MTEKTKPTQETPAPATPATQTETKVDTAPVDSPAETSNKKLNAAFAAQRIKIRELEKKVSAIPTTPPTPAPTEKVEAVVTAPAPTTPAPTPVYVEGTAELEKMALSALATDKDIAKIPDAFMTILDMVDNNARLKHIYDHVDAQIAINEAKKEYLAKVGVSTPPAVPISASPSGGMGGGAADLDALIANCDKYPAGSKKWNEAVAKVNAAIAKR